MPVTPAGTTPSSDDEALRLFGHLSCILTGDVALPEGAVRRHLRTLRDSGHAADLTQVLQRFHAVLESHGNIVDGVGRGLVDDVALGPFVKNILLLWFTGQLPSTTAAAPTASQDDYFEALMWSAIGAHPPGLSDAYFGHWRYPPDEGV